MNVHGFLGSPKQNGPEAVPRAVRLISILFERYIASLTLLLSDSKLRNHFAIAIHIVNPEIIEQPPALADDLQ